MSADVTASIANDAARLPAGSVIVVDDFHAAAAAGRTMTDLVERWPAGTAQLVLAGRVDPPVRLHRLRLSGELCELRNSDLYLSLAESGALLANFGVRVAHGDLALLHGRSEGWVAALQMAALTLRAARDPAQVARALDIRGHAVAEYFICEVVEQQPPEVAEFLLETSVLEELTADACAAVTGRPDAAALLRRIEAANLFLVALDDDRTSYRYHHLVREVLRAQLRATIAAGSSRCSSGQRSGWSPRATRGARPALTLRPGRPAGHWACCTSGWWPTCGVIRPRRRCWTSAGSTRRC